MDANPHILLFNLSIHYMTYHQIECRWYSKFANCARVEANNLMDLSLLQNLRVLVSEVSLRLSRYSGLTIINGIETNKKHSCQYKQVEADSRN
jgi:hypothetical protein